MPQTIAILDFGSQYVQLIARRVRENHVHSLLFAPDVSPDELQKNNVIGLILSGGPARLIAICTLASRASPVTRDMSVQTAIIRADDMTRRPADIWGR